MAKYQKYAEYKDTGIEWLGEIPNHWNVGNLKFSFVGIKNGATETQIEESNNTVPISRIESISTGEINYEKVGFVNKYSIAESYKINEGDIRLSHINSLSMVGNIALKRDTSILYHGMNLLRLMPNKDKFDPKYLFWILKSKYFRNSVESIAKPAINQASVSIDSLKNISLLIPTKIEQQDIANFLDHETAKIDSLIAKQEKLIELLKEKRQAVISHAVTKGLNPDVTMKDSGVEWLGQVPEHWAVAKLAYRYEVLLGKMLDESKITGNYLGKYLRNTDVQWGRVNSENLPEMDFRPHEIERYSVQQGDLLVCEGGEIGRCAIWESEDTCFYQKALHRLRAYSSQDSHKFMFYVLFDSVHRERFISGAGKATIAHLPAETFKQYRFAFPPKNEQVQIVEYLDTMSKAFDEIETKALAQIKLLQERRTALISSAVTGKIDVRNWQHPNEEKMGLSA